VPAEFFVDTSAWYPLVVSKHPDHARLGARLRTLIREHHRLVTTNLVVAETHALLLRRVGRPTALTFVRTVYESPNVVVHSTREIELAAERSWLARFTDQDFSLADAVSFAVMTERRIREALTLDAHFVVAGFQTPGLTEATE
jgi:predicted nucleic acid-binding protein